jgi:hypothetical protein
MAKVSKKTLAKKVDKGAPLPWELARDFMLAGRCVVTLEDVATGDRSTYLVERIIDEKELDDGTVEKTPRDEYFVNLLIGSDNTRNFKYLGFVDKKYSADFAFRTTKGTQKNKSASADNINRFGDTLKWLIEGTDAAHKVRVWHRGLCGKCGKDLTVPSSIATGFGPVCAKQLGIAMKKVDPTAIEKLGALAPIDEETEDEQERQLAEGRMATAARGTCEVCGKKALVGPTDTHYAACSSCAAAA